MTPSHQHNRAGLGELTSRLRRDARKVTGQRQAVLAVLREDRHPLTRKQIHARLAPGTCDLATVYRSLHLLERLGMVKRFDFGDGTARFELLAEDDDGHHHHLICTRCARVVEVEECSLAGHEQFLARTSGFKAISHKLEFFGLCPGCQ